MRLGKPRFILGFLALSVVLSWSAGGFRDALGTLRLFTAPAPAHLPMPVAGVRAVDIRDSWGAPRPGGRRHQGIDIFAPRGRAILSTTPGLVVAVGHNRLGGNVVRVLGPGAEWHYYAHLDAFGPVRPGLWIPAGTLLGYVGDSGNAKGTPSHLHYGIYHAGGAVNPYPRLAGGPRPAQVQGPGPARTGAKKG